MLKKIKLAIAAGIACFGVMSSPASAYYYVSYWLDYPGGTLMGVEMYCDGGNLYQSWGTPVGHPHVDYATGQPPC